MEEIVDIVVKALVYGLVAFGIIAIICVFLPEDTTPDPPDPPEDPRCYND